MYSASRVDTRNPSDISKLVCLMFCSGLCGSGLVRKIEGDARKYVLYEFLSVVPLLIGLSSISHTDLIIDPYIFKS